MEGQAAEPEGQKRRRKADQGQDAPGPPPGKIKTTIDLSFEAVKRLRVHSLGTGKTHSEIVEALINEHLRRFYLGEKSVRDKEDAA